VGCPAGHGFREAFAEAVVAGREVLSTEGRGRARHRAAGVSGGAEAGMLEVAEDAGHASVKGSVRKATMAHLGAAIGAAEREDLVDPGDQTSWRDPE